MMPMYIAEKILSGSQIYAFVFSIKMYQKYQNEVDVILIGEGRQDLIPEDRLSIPK